jgi:SAM-dependent methyltransferase
MSETTAPNADMAAYWNAAAGETWTELSDLLDRQLEDVGLTAMAALAPKPGERILDVGCGCGRTTLELAGRVGPNGAVTGADISRPMLAEARRRAEAARLSQASFREGDVQTEAFPPGAYDAAFSRFGVMFFDDPPAAFGNIRKALKPGGRLAFVCWRALPENPWMLVPMGAALKHLPAPAPPQPGAPGPFAFADAERVRGILQAAGFEDIAIAPHDVRIGGNTLDDSVKLSLRVGPLGAALREHPELAPKVVEDIRAALSQHQADGRVALPGAVWIVTARNP